MRDRTAAVTRMCRPRKRAAHLAKQLRDNGLSLYEPPPIEDVSNVGHFGTGNFEITQSKPEDREGRCRSSAATKISD